MSSSDPVERGVASSVAGAVESGEATPEASANNSCMLRPDLKPQLKSLAGSSRDVETQSVPARSTPYAEEKMLRRRPRIWNSHLKPPVPEGPEQEDPADVEADGEWVSPADTGAHLMVWVPVGLSVTVNPCNIRRPMVEYLTRLHAPRPEPPVGDEPVTRRDDDYFSF